MNTINLILKMVRRLHLGRFYHSIFTYRLPYYRFLQWKRIKSIRKRGVANVVFIVSNMPMWRAQGLYNLLKKDSRFRLYILLEGLSSYTKEENKRNACAMRDYFHKHAMDCYTFEDINLDAIRQEWNPDIIFYPQPYQGSLPSYIDCTLFKDRLMVFIPYGFMTIYREWNYNAFLHNMAWRVYYPTEIHKNNAIRLSTCKGDNVKVVGEPHADYFIYDHRNVIHTWKDDGNKKRIIWAPHFQINPNKTFYRPSFLWTWDLMVEIAKTYKDKIHIAFKPHPRLFTELCNHPDWGEKRAREYYRLWATMPNTQVETGEFIDLFKESDGLIHDCGSFVAEYMFVCKPCLFVTHDEKEVEQEMCNFGKKCFHLHDIGHNKEEIINFIEETILKGKDKKLTERKHFYNQYLMPPYNRTTAMNMYNDITSSLFGSIIQ